MNLGHNRRDQSGVSHLIYSETDRKKGINGVAEHSINRVPVVTLSSPGTQSGLI